MAPRRPTNGSSTTHPAITALGIPTTESMTCFATIDIEQCFRRVSNADITVRGEVRRVLELRPATGQTIDKCMYGRKLLYSVNARPMSPNAQYLIYHIAVLETGCVPQI